MNVLVAVLILWGLVLLGGALTLLFLDIKDYFEEKKKGKK